MRLLSAVAVLTAILTGPVAAATMEQVAAATGQLEAGTIEPSLGCAALSCRLGPLTSDAP
jgi:hypothetical protein